jgi:nitroimidazol reductase NimA-like FMN-containing flavoprotein (pyridoxamine 5'-phosphate oxidase superfamily)
MRRKDKEVLEKDLIELIFREAEICRVAFSQDDQPYLVPLSFGYEPGRLFFHCARAGRKLDMLNRNPRVCFEVEYGCELVRAESPCNFTVHFASVIGFGKAAVVTDPRRKAYGLDLIVKHYGAVPPDYSEEALSKLEVVEIEIEEMTFKKSGPVPQL